MNNDLLQYLIEKRLEEELDKKENIYSEILSMLREWCDEYGYSDLIVCFDDVYGTHKEIVIDDNGDLVWLNDWYEGQIVVKINWFLPIENVEVTISHFNKIKSFMTNYALEHKNSIISDIIRFRK